MLEAGGSSTVFSKDNGGTCLNEYCLSLSVFMRVEYYSVPNNAFKVQGRNTVALVREPLMLQTRQLNTLLTRENYISVRKQ
jgi:hypothetical protein